MNRFLNLLYTAALAAAAAGMAGAGLAAARHHPVALAMTLLIAAFFALGVWELRAFRRVSHALVAALTEAQPDEAWLDRVPAALRGAVQQRLDGLRVPLPGLALAPALTGLMVLLGMLGTFIGLVITLGGTASALNATADLNALRAALGAPVQGLGLAFSASVAGVCASAMLGLMVALARRERAAVVQALDAALRGPLRPLTAAHRQALAEQAAAEVAAQRQDALAASLQQFAVTLGERLSAEQSRFHAAAERAYTALAANVEASLRTGLTEALSESARLAGEAIQPAAEAAFSAVAREATALHERVGAQVGEQLRSLSQRFEAGAERIAHDQQAAAQAQAERWTAERMSLLTILQEQAERHQAAQAEADTARTASLHAQQQALAEQHTALQRAADELATRFAGQTQTLLDGLAEAQARVQATHASHDAERLAAWRHELASAGAAQLAQQQQSADALLAHTQALVAQAEARSRATLSEAGALLKAAGEAPRAAVEVVSALREQLVQSAVQDRAALAERAELMQTVSTLLSTLQQAAGEQRAAIDALVQTSATRLDAVSERFAGQAEATGTQLGEAATRLAASATEIGSLGQGFGAAVEAFQTSNAQLVQHLGALEERLGGVMTRSDEQLGYYVAQAREVIDLCLGAQKQVLDALQSAARG